MPAKYFQKKYSFVLKMLTYILFEFVCNKFMCILNKEQHCIRKIKAANISRDKKLVTKYVLVYSN